MRAKSNSPSPAQRQVQAGAPKTKFLSVPVSPLALAQIPAHAFKQALAMSSATKTTTVPRDEKGHPNAGGNGAVVYQITTTRRLVPRASERRSKMIAFGYYGGKFSHLDFILPLLPTHFTHYCEVFGGSAAVLINRPPAPVETYNDLDGEVVNSFECLRDNGKELVRLISLTPFSRVELVKALSPITGVTKLERARRFFVRARQTRTGRAQTSSEGRWAHCVLE